MGREEKKEKKKAARFIGKYLPALALLCAAALTAGCANNEAQMQADINELQNQTYSLQTQVDKMNNSVEASQRKFSSKNATELHTIRSSQAGVVDQLSTMQRDVDSLRGKLQEQNHLDKKFFADQSSETAGLAKQLAQQQTVLDSLGSRITNLETEFQAQANQLAAQTAQAKQQEQAAAETPQSAYDKAYSIYQKKKYGSARKAFKAFLAKFPDDPLAGNAQFWIAESYFTQKEYDQAILAYEKVIKHYPRSIKVPNALLHQGISFLKTHDPKVAAALFRQVMEKYPKSHEAKTARALIKKVKRSRRG